MNKELYKLFISYQNKELDDKFIYKAFEIIMEYETIEKYVNNFNIIEDKEEILGTYSNEERSIELNKKGIIKDKSICNKK